MLWPEKRDPDKILGDKVPGTIDRTTKTSYLRVPSGYLPDLLKPLQGFGQRFFPWIFGDDGLVIGPIPADTPVDLLANIDLLGETAGVEDKVKHQEKVVALLLKMKKTSRVCRQVRTTKKRKKYSPIWSILCLRSASVPTSWLIAATTSAPATSRKSHRSAMTTSTR